MNRRLLLAIGAVAATAIVAVVVVVETDAVPLDPQPAGCQPLAVRSSAVPPGSDAPEGDQLGFPDRLARAWTIDVDGPTTHLFTWSPERIVWCSYDADGEVLASTSRRTAMEPGDERVHMNLWISQDQPPAKDTEIVITDFRFLPLDGGAPNA